MRKDELEAGTGVRVYERMVVLTTQGRKLRFWVKTDPKEADREFVKWKNDVHEWMDENVQFVESTDPMWVAKEICDQFELVNAVEVLDASGNGALAYSDWP